MEVKQTQLQLGKGAKVPKNLMKETISYFHIFIKDIGCEICQICLGGQLGVSEGSSKSSRVHRLNEERLRLIRDLLDLPLHLLDLGGESGGNQGGMGGGIVGKWGKFSHNMFGGRDNKTKVRTQTKHIQVCGSGKKNRKFWLRGKEKGNFESERERKSRKRRKKGKMQKMVLFT